MDATSLLVYAISKKSNWVLHCSESLLNYCVPSSLKRLGFDSLNTLMVFFNQFDSFHRVLTDLIKSWREMIILCFVALGTLICVLTMISCRWISCIGRSRASEGGRKVPRLIATHHKCMHFVLDPSLRSANDLKGVLLIQTVIAQFLC